MRDAPTAAEYALTIKHDINSESDILRNRQILDDYPHVRLALLFGSLAKGNARKDGDLDLANATDNTLDSRQKCNL